MYSRSLFSERSIAKCIFNEDIPRLADNFPLFTRRGSELIKWVVLLFIYIFMYVSVCACVYVYIYIPVLWEAGAAGSAEKTFPVAGKEGCYWLFLGQFAAFISHGFRCSWCSSI